MSSKSLLTGHAFTIQHSIVVAHLTLSILQLRLADARGQQMAVIGQHWHP